MKKDEFLRELESRLQILNEAERKDIIDEYSQHIELKIANGLNEEEAARDFGDIKELAGEILSAYNVNLNYNKPDVKKTCLYIGEKIQESFKKIGIKFMGWWKVIKGKVKYTIDKNNEYSTIRNNKQLEQLRSQYDGDKEQPPTTSVIRSKDVQPRVMQPQVPQEEAQEEAQEEVQEEVQESTSRIAPEATPGKMSGGISPSMNNRYVRKAIKSIFGGICVGLMRLFAFFIWLPMVFVLLISIFIFGCCMVLSIQGYPLIGIMIATLGGVLCTGTLSFLLGSYCFSGKERGKKNEQIQDK